MAIVFLKITRTFHAKKIFCLNADKTENKSITNLQVKVLKNHYSKSSAFERRFFFEKGVLAKLSLKETNSIIMTTALECEKLGQMIVFAEDTNVLHISRGKCKHFTAVFPTLCVRSRRGLPEVFLEVAFGFKNLNFHAGVFTSCLKPKRANTSL